MSRRDWRTAVHGTWLGQPGKRQRIDLRVREWFMRRRGLSHNRIEDVIAFTVERAYNDVISLGLGNSWLPVTTTLALLGELVLCAHDGTTLSELLKTYDPDINEGAWLMVLAMNLLRNIACHPGNPPIEQLCSHIRSREPEKMEFAKRLEQNWSLSGTREFAEYTLIKVDAAGEHVLERYHR